MEMTCTREPCPADDPSVNPRHLWNEADDERWRFYPDEAPASEEGDRACESDVMCLTYGCEGACRRARGDAL